MVAAQRPAGQVVSLRKSPSTLEIAAQQDFDRWSEKEALTNMSALRTVSQSLAELLDSLWELASYGLLFVSVFVAGLPARRSGEG